MILSARKLSGEEDALDITAKLAPTTPEWSQGNLFSLESVLFPGRSNRVKILEVMHAYENLDPDQELWFWEEDTGQIVVFFLLIPLVQSRERGFRNHIVCVSKRTLEENKQKPESWEYSWWRIPLNYSK